ncbi:UNVERIFIED_CONTAM: RHS repeat-associated protein [Paenibacillus sp. PvR008]
MLDSVTDAKGRRTSYSYLLAHAGLTCYSGELRDDTTELQYLRARWYDPANGRFINEDTYEGDIKNPLSLNLYIYVSNNPLIYVDPTRCTQEIGGSEFDTRTIGSNGVLYNKNDGSVAWDYYLGWRKKDR